MTDENWKPKIIAIICNWCSYAGADLAGGARIQYPPDVRAIRVMCTGRVDPLFIMKAFQDGADGMLISGCHFGDCHYLEGNYKCAKRMFLVKNLLKNIGLDDNRLRMTFVSASEGAKWGAVMTDVVKTVKELGPSPIKKLREITESEMKVWQLFR